MHIVYIAVGVFWVYFTALTAPEDTDVQVFYILQKRRIFKVSMSQLVNNGYR